MRPAAESETLYYSHMSSPVGVLLLVLSEGGLVALEFGDAKVRAEWIESAEKTALVTRQLEEYFAGRRRKFNVPLDLRGTDFQKRCWQELLKIPYGETRSYADIARAIGNPLAVRAVGLANGQNPTAIIVPCHRVIGSDGSLTGYGGGLEIKRKLLELEGALSCTLSGTGMTPIS
jgi:O-6-methylguanine DNA methyltransferase